MLRRLVAFMYEQPATLIDYFKNNAIVIVDEFNRVKETEEALTVETEDFMSQLIESGKGFIGQQFLKDDRVEYLLEDYKITYFTLLQQR